MNFEKQVYTKKEVEELMRAKDEEINELKKKNKTLEIDLAEADDIIEFLNSSYEGALGEIRFDEVTGLKNRRELFKKITPQIENLLVPVDDGEDGEKVKKMTDEDWVETIKNTEKNFEDTDFNIMMSDISFLGLANDLLGHNNGDILLKGVSDEMKAILIDCSRHGGDEIAGAYNEPIEVLIEKAKEVKKRVNGAEDLAGLNEFGLRPNIDIGFAKFSEGISVFKKILEEHPEVEKYQNNVLRELQNIWIDIADKRVYIHKAKERLALLLDRRKGDKEILDSLRKAAYSIKDKDIDELEGAIDGDENKMETEFEKFIKKKELEKMKDMSKGDMVKNELILELLGL